MHIAIVGAGAVGGYYGARLAHAGQRVTFVARGVQLKAIQERGLLIWSPLGDFQVHVAAEADPQRIGPVDAVLFTVKSYDLTTAAALLPPLVGPDTMVMTLQNGVDAPLQLADIIGPKPIVGGATYIGTVIKAPGLIEQTGTHRRIVLGEVFDPPAGISPRVRRLADTLEAADIQIEAVADMRAPLWEKFIILTSLASFCAAGRVASGEIWSDPLGRRQFIAAMQEIERVARAEGVPIPEDIVDRHVRYLDALPPVMRPSMLADLTAGKRLELDALTGSVVKRGAAAGVPTPIMSTLYTVLKPHAVGRGA